jgi:hypothetical protein
LSAFASPLIRNSDPFSRRALSAEPLPLRPISYKNCVPSATCVPVTPAALPLTSGPGVDLARQFGLPLHSGSVGWIFPGNNMSRSSSMRTDLSMQTVAPPGFAFPPPITTARAG